MSPDEPRSHPNSIVKFRVGRGMSARQLAAATRLSRELISDLETGRTKPHAGHLNLLARVFECLPDDLLVPCISPRQPRMPIKQRYRNLEMGRKGGKLRIPDSAHPMVRCLFERMNEHDVGMAELSAATGVSSHTISGWRRNYPGGLENLAACFNALGYDLTIRKKDK